MWWHANSFLDIYSIEYNTKRYLLLDFILFLETYIDSEFEACNTF